MPQKFLISSQRKTEHPSSRAAHAMRERVEGSRGASSRRDFLPTPGIRREITRQK
jgi:hypothetical protein